MFFNNVGWLELLLVLILAVVLLGPSQMCLFAYRLGAVVGILRGAATRFSNDIEQAVRCVEQQRDCGTFGAGENEGRGGEGRPSRLPVPCSQREANPGKGETADV